MTTTYLTLATATRAAIQKLRQADPAINQTEMARRLGVSRQRVHQILIDLGLPLVYRPARKVKNDD